MSPVAQAVLSFVGALTPGILIAAVMLIHGRIRHRRQDAQWAREDAEAAQASRERQAFFDRSMKIWETEGVEAALDYINHTTKLPTSNKA